MDSVRLIAKGTVVKHYSLVNRYASHGVGVNSPDTAIYTSTFVREQNEIQLSAVTKAKLMRQVLVQKERGLIQVPQDLKECWTPLFPA